MDKVGLVFEQFVDTFYYISLAQHHLVPQGHKLDNFALGHLPFAVSHALISLVYGGDM